jgi:hypothetical protein
MVKVGWRGGKEYGSEESRDEKWSKERSCAGSNCTQSEPRVHVLNLAKAVNDEILMLTWGSLLKGDIFLH